MSLSYSADKMAEDDNTELYNYYKGQILLDLYFQNVLQNKILYLVLTTGIQFSDQLNSFDSTLRKFRILKFPLSRASVSLRYRLSFSLPSHIRVWLRFTLLHPTEISQKKRRKNFSSRKKQVTIYQAKIFSALRYDSFSSCSLSPSTLIQKENGLEPFLFLSVCCDSAT